MAERESGRDHEAVAEEAEAGTRTPVEPDEEQPRPEKMRAEIEDVHPLDERRHGQDRPLERELPRQVRDPLECRDPPRVIERERPVGSQSKPHRLVRADRGEHDPELHEPVPA